MGHTVDVVIAQLLDQFVDDFFQRFDFSCQDDAVGIVGLHGRVQDIPAGVCYDQKFLGGDVGESETAAVHLAGALIHVDGEIPDSLESDQCAELEVLRVVVDRPFDIG